MVQACWTNPVAGPGIPSAYLYAVKSGPGSFTDVLSPNMNAAGNPVTLTLDGPCISRMFTADKAGVASVLLEYDTGPSKFAMSNGITVTDSVGLVAPRLQPSHGRWRVSVGE
jgi:hypothetical protein